MTIAMDDMTANGWTEYQRLVMNTLEQHEKKLELISHTLTDIKVEIGMLKVKAGLWGTIGGVIPMAFAIAMIWIKKVIGLE